MVQQANAKEIKLIRSWAESPRKFIVDVLKFEEKGFKLTTQQEQAIEEVRKLVWAKIKSGKNQPLTEEEKEYAKKMGISIMAGKGLGKDLLASMIILWFIICFPSPKIGATANSSKQLKDVLWSEIRKWAKGTAVDDWLTFQSERIFMKTEKKDDWGKQWFVTARTVNAKSTADEQAETLAGLHEDYMLFVIDEASGIPDPVFRPFETTLTGICNWIFMIFNPTQSRGYAVDSHTKNREHWVCLQWDAEESELAQNPQFKAQIERLEKAYGRDSNVFRINVKGRPPIADSDTLMPWDWVNDAIDRDMVIQPDDPIFFGIDVGAGGDKSVVCIRQGCIVKKLYTYNTVDTMELVGRVSNLIEEYEPQALFVDNIGIGIGVYNRLQELGHRVFAVDVRRKGRNEDKFQKLRDELWWALRTQFEKGTISIPKDDELIAELTTIKYKPESDGRIKVESKKDMKARGLHSPDRADSLMMTYFMGENAFRHSVREQGKYNKKSNLDSTSWMVA